MKLTAKARKGITCTFSCLERIANWVLRKYRFSATADDAEYLAKELEIRDEDRP